MSKFKINKQTNTMVLRAYLEVVDKNSFVALARIYATFEEITKRIPFFCSEWSLNLRVDWISNQSIQQSSAIM